MSRRRRVVAAVTAALTLVGVLTGCASVPTSSDVKVVKQLTEGDNRVLPPGPGDGVNPLDLVRGFVYASGSTADRHGAARRFLGSEAAGGWEDGASLTILAEQFDTVYAEAPGGSDAAIVRIRGARIGQLNAAGSFEPADVAVQIDIRVGKENGQWRIAGLPAGTVVRQSDFQASYDAAKVYFVDPVRRATVADLRYLPSSPARTRPSRVVEMLLAGPSPTLSGSAVSLLPATAQLRSNVAEATDSILTVDLTGLGELDDATRRLLAAQVLKSLAEVNVTRARLLADGAPLLADRNNPLIVADIASLTGESPPGFEGGLGAVVVDGKLRSINGPDLGGPVPGPAGAGGYDIVSAGLSADGQRLAVVSRRGQLLVGRSGLALNPTGLQAGSMIRPTWAPAGAEVWTALNGTTGARLIVGADGSARVGSLDLSEVSAIGPIADLRLSRDGVRVAAVAGRHLVVGSVIRSASGDVAVRNVRTLRSAELAELVSVDWNAEETLAVASQRADRPVSLVSLDGLDLRPMPSTNLTPPLTTISAGARRPLLVADQGGVWSYTGGELNTWRQLVGATSGAVPVYPS